MLATCAGLGLLAGSSVNIAQGALPLFAPPPSEAIVKAARDNSPSSLDSMSRFELVRLWCALPAPADNTIRGYHAGTILRKGPLHLISRLMTHRFFGPGSWAGKDLSPNAEKAGVNIFRSRRDQAIYQGSRNFGMKFENSRLDRRPCLTLDYSSDGSNAFPWCGMRDEVRELKPGVYLGLGSMKVFGGPLNSAVFILEKKKAPLSAQ